MFNITNKIIKSLETPYKLNNIKRFQTEYTLHSESVAAHSFFVVLAVIELSKYYNFDLSKAIKMAIIHDLPESYIGDFPFHIKKENPATLQVFDKLDQKYMSNYMHLFSDVDVMCLISEFNKKDTIEGVICGYADMLSSLLFCETEIKLNNSLFESRQQSKYKICLEYEEKLESFKK